MSVNRKKIGLSTSNKRKEPETVQFLELNRIKFFILKESEYS